jgi:hypothetical protein
VPASDTARFVIFSAVIVLAATTVIIATQGRPASHGRPLRHLGQVLAVVELVTEDDAVGCDLVLTRERVMGAAAGFENR